MNKYGLNIIWSEEDQSYVATCPELPGLSAFGETVEDAIAEAKIAQELFVETYAQEGMPLPEPQPLNSYSGQFRLRIPQSLHHQLVRMAKQEGVSLNQLILMILATRTGSEQVTNKLQGIVDQMEKRLVKCTLANTTEMAVALMKAVEAAPTYTQIRHESTSGIPGLILPTSEHSTEVS
jgi:predicted RNase H-like HicB family nuclease